MADAKQLVQNILEKNAIGAKEQFSAILEQKITAIIQNVIPLVAENMVSDQDTMSYDEAEGTELEEKTKFGDEQDEIDEKKARKDRERNRSAARDAKKKEVEEEVDLQEKIHGSEYAPADLVNLHVAHQKQMAHVQNAVLGSGNVTSASDAIKRASKFESQINSHPQTIGFHQKHGFDAEHPAKKIARNTSHLHEERNSGIISRILTNLNEKAKFDDDDGSDYKDKDEKKKKELARSKAREAKKTDSED